MRESRSFRWYVIGFIALVISTYFLTLITVYMFNLGREEKLSFPESFYRPTGERLIFAHRGLTDSTIENTLSSFQAARDLGADVLETDVQITLDGEVVIFHDQDLQRMGGRPETVPELSLKEIQSLLIPPGCTECERIPTLQEFLDAFPDQPINIELKNDRLDLAQKVARLLDHRQDRRDVIVGSAHAEAIEEFRRFSSLPTAAHTSEVIHASICYLLDMRCEFGFQALQLPYRPDSLLPALRAEPNFLDWAHNRGLRVDYWTINEDRDMKILLERQVDGIMTDRPGRALQLREELGRNSSYQGPGTDTSM